MKWINAFRLRTLPLAFSCIIMGSGLAFGDDQFNLTVFVLALITTLFLQILSNLANDYGDFVKGTDNKNRVGPERTLQAGLITKDEMVTAMWIIALLCSVFGVWLIYEGTKGLDLHRAGLIRNSWPCRHGRRSEIYYGKKPLWLRRIGRCVCLFVLWLAGRDRVLFFAHAFD